jgi:(S)-mandelate dehydrogenase
MNYKAALNIDDLRRIAERRLPRVAWEFLERGAEEETTLAENRAAFERIRLRPRTLVDVSKRSQQVMLFGKSHAAPFGIAPTGAAGLYSFEADVALARAAATSGVFVALERVAREAGGSKWFQLYMSKDRDAARTLVARARDAGYEALVVTTDVPVGGNREFNRRNGFDIPFRLNVRNAVDGVLHPHWLVNVFMRTLLSSGVPRFRNTDVGGRIVARNLGEFRARREALDWSDLDWLREFWPRKLLVKGVLTVADALQAENRGADGIFVSNHGGRQLDGAPAPVEVLPEIAAAVGDRLRIMFDSGVRRGSDIVKALALGADMVFVGRAPLYGVCAGGEAGVVRALDILRSEVDRVMGLLGCTGVEALDAGYLSRPDGLRPICPQPLHAVSA